MAVRTVRADVRLSLHKSSSFDLGSVEAAIEQEEEARSVFEQYDDDKDGALSPAEHARQAIE